MRLSLFARHALAALVLLAAASPSRGQSTMSPSIQELAAELGREGRVAEQRFWEMVEERGAALVEPAESPGTS